MSALAEVSTPVSPRDAINRRILEVSEDRIRGFVREPFEEIAKRSGLDVSIVIERIRAMLQAGVIRRVRQTLLATNLAQGALIAWKIDEPLVDGAFRFIGARDPFSGHVVIRNSETGTTDWRLWTTLKVPTGFSVERHCEYLRREIGAEKYRVMPALRAFVLGVGHMRRKGMRIGEMSRERAVPTEPSIVQLSDRDWDVLLALKRDPIPMRSPTAFGSAARAPPASIRRRSSPSPKTSTGAASSADSRHSSSTRSPSPAKSGWRASMACSIGRSQADASSRRAVRSAASPSSLTVTGAMPARN